MPAATLQEMLRATAQAGQQSLAPCRWPPLENAPGVASEALTGYLFIVLSRTRAVLAATVWPLIAVAVAMLVTVLVL
jgi:hypothetical protein